jgi:hypothetical protein
LHAGVHRYATPAEVDRTFRRMRDEVRAPVTVLGMARVLSRLAPVIRDGHTDLTLPAEGELLVLPFDVRVIGKRLFADGREIVDIDGVPAERLIRETAAMQWRDGDSLSRPLWLLGRSHAFRRALAILRDAPSSYEVTFAGQRPLTVRSAPTRSRRASVMAHASLTFLDDGAIAVLRIPSFGPDLRSTFARDFAEIAKRRSSVLVIDLRDNGGGLDRNGAELFGHLTARPFEYYRGAGLQQPVEPRFDGKVIVLMNGGTFSAAAEFVSVAHQHQRAQFIGEECGGAYGGNTSGRSQYLTLPHSGITVEIPMVRYEMAVSRGALSRGVLPDIEVTPSIDDVVAGRDPAMKRALELARSVEQPAKRARRRSGETLEDVGEVRLVREADFQRHVRQ